MVSEGQRLVWRYRDLLLRKWPFILGAGLLGLSVVAWVQRESGDTYFAEVTLQRHDNPAPLEAFTPVGSGAEQSLASEIEILTTTAMLGPVVDSLGLRLEVLEPAEPRSRIFREVRIEPRARAGEFRLEPEGDGLRLSSLDGGVVATAGETEILSGDGFLLIADRQHVRSIGGARFKIHAREQAIDALTQRLGIRRLEGTNLLKIEYRARDPVVAAAVPNAIAGAYQEYATARARMEATRRKQFIEARLASVADSLGEAQVELLDFQATARTVSPQEEGQRLAQLLVAEQERLREFRRNEQILENLLVSFRTEGRSDEALRQTVVLSGEFFPAAGALYGRLQELETQRNNLTASPLVGRTSNDPRVQAIDSAINVTKIEMREIAAQSLELLRQRRIATDTRVQELEAQVSGIPERRTTFGRLQQRVDAIQRMHDLLAEKYYEAQIAEAVEAGNVEIVEAAYVPTAPLPGNHVRNLFLGLIGGLVLGTLLGSVQEQLDTRLRDETDAVNAAATELIARVPLLRSANGGPGPVVTEGRNLEAFRMLRTNLRFARAEQPRTILITSPAPREGKSLVAANLAASYVRDGARVLLIDADLRRPTQHVIFSTPREPGLSDCLIGQADTRAARRLLIGGLALLPAGTPVPNPPELLGSAAFKKLLGQATGEYDIIIIDAPPILAVTDSSVMLPLVDGVVLVSRFKQTDLRALAAASDQVQRAGPGLLGMVVNAIPHSAGGRGYYSAYYTDYYEGETPEVSRSSGQEEA